VRLLHRRDRVTATLDFHRVAYTDLLLLHRAQLGARRVLDHQGGANSQCLAVDLEPPLAPPVVIRLWRITTGGALRMHLVGLTDGSLDEMAEEFRDLAMLGFKFSRARCR